MRTVKDRVEVDAVGVPVTLDYVRINAAVLVVTDQDGVVVIPAAHASEVLTRGILL